MASAHALSPAKLAEITVPAARICNYRERGLAVSAPNADFLAGG
jgi:hypothetical protein